MDESAIIGRLLSAQKRQGQQYLQSIAQREKRDRGSITGRYVTHDSESGEVLAWAPESGITRATSFSNLAPRTGQLGRLMGGGFDIGQGYATGQPIHTTRALFPFMGLLADGTVDLHLRRTLIGERFLAPIGPLFPPKQNQFWTFGFNNDVVSWFIGRISQGARVITEPLQHAGGEYLYTDRQIHTSELALQPIAISGNSIISGSLKSGELQTLQSLRSANNPPFTESPSNQQTTIFSISNANDGNLLVQVAFTAPLGTRQIETAESVTQLPVYRSVLANENLQRVLIDSGVTEQTVQEQDRFFAFASGPTSTDLEAYQTVPSIGPLSPFWGQGFRTGAIAHFGLLTRTIEEKIERAISQLYLVESDGTGTPTARIFGGRRQRTAFEIGNPSGSQYPVINGQQVEENLFENFRFQTDVFDGFSFDFALVDSSDTTTGLTVAELVATLEGLPNHFVTRQFELQSGVPTQVPYNASDWGQRPRFFHSSLPGESYACLGVVSPAIASPNLGATSSDQLVQVRNFYVDPSDSAGHIIESLNEGGYRVTYAFCDSAIANAVPNSNLTVYQSLNLSLLSAPVDLEWFPGAIAGITRFVPTHPVPMGIDSSNSVLWTEDVDIETFFAGSNETIPNVIYVTAPEGSVSTSYVLALDALNLTLLESIPERPNPRIGLRVGRRAPGDRQAELYIPNYSIRVVS